MPLADWSYQAFPCHIATALSKLVTNHRCWHQHNALLRPQWAWCRIARCTMALGVLHAANTTKAPVV
jgi:hypothetical protein